MIIVIELKQESFYTCLFIYSHLDLYGCTVQYFTHVCLFTATWIPMAAPSSILHMICLFTATWIPMAAPSSILHVSVYLQPPGSLWLHCPVFYTCLFIYSHLDPYSCTVQYFTCVCLFKATWIPMAALSSILHMSVYLQPPGSLQLHCPVFYMCLFI